MLTGIRRSKFGFLHEFLYLRLQLFGQHHGNLFVVNYQDQVIRSGKLTGQNTNKLVEPPPDPVAHNCMLTDFATDHNSQPVTFPLTGLVPERERAGAYRFSALLQSLYASAAMKTICSSDHIDSVSGYC